jgi:hypothetical protein
VTVAQFRSFVQYFLFGLGIDQCTVRQGPAYRGSRHIEMHGNIINRDFPFHTERNLFDQSRAFLKKNATDCIFIWFFLYFGCREMEWRVRERTVWRNALNVLFMLYRPVLLRIFG